jgi:molybdenum cofactor synthesis domain-containing protein
MLNQEIRYGEFAENITTKGRILYELSPLDRLKIGEAELEITQIGKECHGKNCAIFQEVGNCVMPKEGIFTRVVSGGEIRAGMNIEYIPYVYQIRVVTLSDRASRGEYADRSGPVIIKRMEDFYAKTNKSFQVHYQVIPDEAESLNQLLDQMLERHTDIFITTGGTGIGPRDITPDVIRPRLTREIPGIMEMMRVKYGAEKPGALLSRGVAGLMGNTLVYTLPGSVKAVQEHMEEILKTLQHAIWMLHGLDIH